MGFAFARKEYRNNTLSIVSNLIQLILNALAFTVALVLPLWNYKDYHAIMRQFEKVDCQFNSIDLQPNYKKEMFVFVSATLTFLLLMFINCGFDFYVSIIKDNVNIAYWTLYSMPLLTYGAGLHQSIFLIYLIHKRLKVASRVLEFRILPLLEGSKIPDLHNCSCGGRCTNGQCLETAHQESLSKVYPIINDIYVICLQLNEYFGPVFLTSLTALFAVTSVQCFYCFVLASNLGDNPENIWNLIDSFNMVVVNILLVIAICCMTELVVKNVDRIVTSIIVDQQKKQVGENCD